MVLPCLPQNGYPHRMEAENTVNEAGRAPRVPPVVTVLVQPEEKQLTLPRPKTARQLLAALGLREETALVARDGELLTPDRQVLPGDSLLVRKVASAG